MKRFFLALMLVLADSGVYGQNPPAQAQSKEALLIANGNYSHFGKLPNPLSDAHLLGASLEKIGFHVSLVENASREGMLDALQSFQDRLKTSHGIALFHYGGHGVQVNGRNFLIPVDADIPDEKKVTTRAVDLEEVMTTLDGSGSEVNVVVLDACRDNPLPASTSRSASRGLSVVQTKPKNSLIVYAAEPGSKAEDGLFTPTLAELIVLPGKSLSQVFKEVRKLVYQKSQGNQTPGEYDQLFDDVYLCDISTKKNTLPSMPSEVLNRVNPNNSIQNNVPPPTLPPEKTENSNTPPILVAKDNSPNESVNGIVKMSMSNRGRSSVASEATPLGRYKKAIADAIGARWYYHVDERMGLLSIGTVSVSFKVTGSGKVTGLHVVSGNSNESLTDCSLRSIMDAKLPPIPKEVLESQGNNGIDINYSFTIY